MSTPRGDTNPKAKVTEKQIVWMQEMRRKGWQTKEIAREFGLHPSSVSRLLHGRGRAGSDAG